MDDCITTYNRWNTYHRQLAAQHRDYDLPLTPTPARSPVRIGELDTQPLLRVRTGRAAEQYQTAEGGRYRQPRTGALHPAREHHRAPRDQRCPPRTSEGLQLGVQFVGPLGRALLLPLAAQLDDARPWAHPEPPLVDDR